MTDTSAMYRRVLTSPRLSLAWNLLKEYAQQNHSSLSSHHLMCYVCTLQEFQVQSLVTEYMSAVYSLYASRSLVQGPLSLLLTTILQEAERRQDWCESSTAFVSWCSTTAEAERKTQEL